MTAENALTTVLTALAVPIALTAAAIVTALVQAARRRGRPHP